MKKKEVKHTLAYAVAFLFTEKVNFRMDGRIYQHIYTVYDEREDGDGFNTCEVVYDYSAQKYKVLVMEDKSIGEKEIEILNVD